MTEQLCVSYERVDGGRQAALTLPAVGLQGEIASYARAKQWAASLRAEGKTGVRIIRQNGP